MTTELADVFTQIAKLDPVAQEVIATGMVGMLQKSTSGPVRKKKRPLPYPSIVRTPGVCGGAARFIRTRIPVWTVMRMQQLGMTDAVILTSYPTLRAVDLAEAWAFADDHREEIDRDIRENEEEG